MDKYGLSFDNYEANMVSYIINGEILSETLSKMLKMPGEKKFLGEDYNLMDSIYNDYEEYKLGLNSKNIWKNTEEFLKNIKTEIDYSAKLHSLNSFYKKE